jgi:glycosyltransferase involved in cell wall biosynthesis
MICPNVDVILPFNKVDEYLPLAIKSVFASVGVQVRLILIDDRLDSSGSIPDLPGQNVVILRTAERGYGNAISLGLRKVSSEFFALMNADDLVHPNRLNHQIRDLLKTNSELSVGRVIKFNNSGIVVSQKLGNLRSRTYSSEALLLGAYGADATWCGRTSVIKAWAFSVKPATDWITALNHFEHTQITYSSSAIYFYRQHASQVTKSKSYSRNAFQDVYPSWAALCQRLNLSVLDEDTSVLVAAPWATSTKPSNEKVTASINWLNSFQDFTHHRYSNLVNRRMLFLLRNSTDIKGFSPLEFFSALKGLFSYLLETILSIFRTIRFRKLLILK